VSANVIQIDRVSWHPEHAIAEVDHLSAEAALRAGELIRARADERVPFLTGDLESSAMVNLGHDGEVAVGYSTDYATILHAHPEWNYNGGRSGRWLDEAVDMSEGEVALLMEETMRMGWPRS
jgi:hypothetical protein